MRHLKPGDRIESPYFGKGTVEGEYPEDRLCMIVLFDDDGFGQPIRHTVDCLEREEWRWLSPLETLAEAAD